MATKVEKGQGRATRGADAGRSATQEQASASARLGRLLPLSSLYTRDAMERVQLVKEGVPARLLVVLADEMAISKEKLYATIGVARATADRKIRAGASLSTDEGERALGLARLVGQVAQIVVESGVPDGFDAARWTAGWLDRPHPALDGAAPATLMDTAEGRSIVSDLVAQMQSGAYA